MEIAIIGLPQSGKTTIFNSLTRGKADTSGAAGSSTEMHVGVVKVPDQRVDVLAKMYRPKKVVYAEIKYWDLPGPEALATSQGIGGRYRNVLQTADAFMIVLRAFENPSVPLLQDTVDAFRDLEAMLAEVSFADMEVLERAVQRLDGNLKKAKAAERPTLARHQEAVRKVKQALENGTPLRHQRLTDSENSFLANYQLLTGKPVIVAFNIDEAGAVLSLGQTNGKFEAYPGIGEVSLRGKLEAELALMSPEEEVEFRKELDIGESATAQAIRTTYATVGLVSFFTVGEDEVRAWTIRDGLLALEAAGTIHTDFTRGFVRAEVITYDDLARCGSLAQGRKEGVLRSEGKTYSVKDGDVINFLVSV